MLCSLLRRELHHKGIELSIPAMLDELSSIHEVAVIYPPKGKKKHPRIETTVSKMSEDQQALFDTLGLQSYLSR